MSNLRSTLARASSYSDGGSRKDLPPTYQDVEMRRKHTADSVEYNLDHAEDHFAELCSQLEKLASVDRGQAEKLASKVCAYLDKVHDDVQPYSGGHSCGRS